MNIRHRCLPFSLITPAVAVAFSFFAAHAAFASTNADITAEIATKNQQIEELQRQIDEYQRQIDENRTRSLTLENEIRKLNALISQVTLEIRSLSVSVDQTNLEIGDTEAKIDEALKTIERDKLVLGQYLRLAYANDSVSLTEVLLNHDTFSDFFSDLHNTQVTQEHLRSTIEDIRGLKEDLDDQKETLEGKKADLERLKGLQEIERRSLSSNKSERDKILRETKGQEAKFQDLMKKSKLDLDRLREQIYYLQQSGITVEDAVKYAQLAAISAGIRPAFLLALLEVESRLGLNVGKGNWQDDMYLCYMRLSKLARTAERRDYYIGRAESEKAAFLQITSSLGKDPNSLRVSKEPSYGCGGAMGPAQFIPTTWLRYAEKVVQLTGRSIADPWNTEDAFTAAAIKLAAGGAASKTRDGELKAAKTYISGNPNCAQSICNSYSSTILRKAAEIEQSLSSGS